RVDAAMVPLVHGPWAEARTLAVGEPHLTRDAAGQAQVQTTARSSFSRLTDSSTFAELASVEIQRHGVETAEQVGAVVDGAEWCQTFLDLHAPRRCASWISRMRPSMWRRLGRPQAWMGRCGMRPVGDSCSTISSMVAQAV